MKIAGQTIQGQKPIDLPFARRNEDGSEYFISFKITPVTSLLAFETKFPLPSPPLKKDSDGPDYYNDKDPEYIKQIQKYSDLKLNWIILEALKSSDITWDTVTDCPTTWSKWRKETQDSGFSWDEIVKIENTCIELAGLVSTNMEQVRKRFLAWRREKVVSK